MSQEILTTSTANRNLAAGATVLSATPDASNPRFCYALIQLGSISKPLVGTAGNFTVTVTIDGNVLLGGNEVYPISAGTRISMQTAGFCVPANKTITIAITSPNAGDTDVACTVYLMSESSAGMAVGDIDGYTLEESMKLMLSALAGKLSGASSTNVSIRAADDSKARITATVDSSGNRTAVTLDATG